MRGRERRQDTMFSYVSMEDRIPADHPLRGIRRLVDEVLKELSGRFNQMYASVGRPSIPPEQLLRALLLQALYTIRSERQLMEQLDYNLLFRWFVGLTMDDEVWVPTVFTKNRDRLLEGDIANVFFVKVVGVARDRGLLSDEHFTVDGTLLEAWAGAKSFKPKDDRPDAPPDDPGNPTVNFHGQKRSNDTHQSTTDPESRLFRKSAGKEAKLSYMGHAITDNKHGLAVASRLTIATGRAEAEAALEMLKELRRQGCSPRTMGGDKWYDQSAVVVGMRKAGVTPHVAQKSDERWTAIDARTTRHPGYTLSQRKRKLIEEVFGWVKSVAGLRKVRHRGKARVGWMFTFVLTVFNLVRINNLTAKA
jgi:transposase